MSEQWKVRVGTDEQPVSGPAEIAELVKAGKANAETYVWNPVLQKWLYARDVGELAPAFKRKRAGYLNHVSWMLFLLAILFEFVLGLTFLGGLAFLGAIGCAVAYYIVGGRASGCGKGALGVVAAFATAILVVVVVGVIVPRLSSKSEHESGQSEPVLLDAQPQPARTASPEPPATRAANAVASEAIETPPESALADQAELPLMTEDEVRRALDEMNRRQAESRSAKPAPRERVTVTIEMVYASGRSRLFHRKGCEDFSPDLVRVRIDTARAQMIRTHDACANLPGEFETFQQ